MSAPPYAQENVTVFWEFETTQISNASPSIPIHEVVKNLRDAVRPFGPIKALRAYWDFSGQRPNLRSELSSLSSSGVSLIDCPGNGRKDLAMKIMLVDLIAHAWDTSPPHTFVVITADHDVAYAISTLRMRGYRVVTISPSGTTRDFCAQGSVNLELTRALLGLKQDVGADEFPDDSGAPAEPTTFTQRTSGYPASSTSQYQKARSTFTGTNQHERPSAGFELRDLPTTRPRRDSVFSYDPRKFGIFDMEDIPATSGIGRGSFGLGDRPLFPRSQSRAEAESRSRADSAPPNMFSTGALSAYGGFGEKKHESPNGPSSKGKQRDFPPSEPEDIAPYPGGAFSHMPYSGSVFEPFGETRPPFQSAFSFSPPRSKPEGTRSSSTSSSSSSRDSPFSLVPSPENNAETSTAPTSGDTFAFTHNHQPLQKEEIVIEVVNGPTRKSPQLPSGNPPQTEAAPQISPPISSSANETPQKVAQTSTGPKAETPASVKETPTPVVVPPVPTNMAAQPPPVAAKKTAKPATSSNTPSTMIAGSSKQAAETSPKPSVPASFQLLANVLRNNGAMTMSTLGAALLKSGRNPYSEYKNLTKLVSAAAEAGIVERRQNSDVCRLRETYA
ncbi:hypothetical protein M413DRAFT_21167 [Hebeloma cylindrosporum]|uniref:NYN domain-containing protein n=1 Tax=Hebeloma cylindrosporum TaxID=76867 RepID=A0A0C3CJH2_HEBCY|nr:hypothetical protein M413DRAFT_21167 [Hebeloma cylindrosporum h7]